MYAKLVYVQNINVKSLYYNSELKGAVKISSIKACIKYQRLRKGLRPEFQT